MCNMELRTRGLDMLATDVSATELFARFFQTDTRKEQRQAGAVDAKGRVATFTGRKCQPWSGGRAKEDPDGSFAAQGNMLAGPQVIDAMVGAWRHDGDLTLARRLVQALDAGQAAGGDSRGKQAAAVLVVGKDQGYGGLSDIAVDLRCDNAKDPISELFRMLDLHDLYFGATPEDQLLPLDQALTTELNVLLNNVGYNSGNVVNDLRHWMGRENFEERWRDGKLDPVVLAQLKIYSN
jgi:uncharacterized Ntn-hydrolase superfamily protein